MILGTDVNHQLAELDALRSTRSRLEARVAELELVVAIRERQLRRVERELAATRNAKQAPELDGGSEATEGSARALAKAA
jgi:hypothetical protein